MRRAGRPRPKTSPGMSLFPFLAVLICTMGSLIVLLVVVVRQAQVQAATTAKEAVTRQQSDLKTEREMAQWRISQMKNSKMREKTEAELAEARLKLGHVEDHSRQLRDQLAKLMAAWNELNESGDYKNHNREELASRLADIRARIAEAQRRLQEARDAASQKPHSYAIVPYQGPHKTQRRPIYIECRRDAVVLQPENITFTEADFDGPLGPGNPLAAALRTVREYLLMREDFDPGGTSGDSLADRVEPYPLLLIRPGGIAAYYAARAAMESWGSEFGYELVEADWELEFQPADPRLAKLINREIEGARLRQRRLAAAAPRQYGSSRPREYTVSNGVGGVVPYGNSQGAHDDDNYSRRRGPFGGHDDSPDNGHGHADGSTSGRETGFAAGNGSTGNGSAGETHGVTLPGDYPYGKTADGSNTNNRSGSYPHDHVEDANQGAGEYYPAGQDGGPYGSGNAHAMGNEANRQGPRMGSATGNFTGNAAQQAAGTSSQGQATPTGARGGSGSQGANSQSSGSRQQAGAAESTSTQVESLAKTRGRNWGLPGATRGAVPITRPIEVQCHADRIQIAANRGHAGKTIQLGPGTKQSIDEFVSTVWSHVESWGIAGRGMYWRPVLNVSVAPGAQRRYAELSGLLDGSGLIVNRK